MRRTILAALSVAFALDVACSSSDPPPPKNDGFCTSGGVRVAGAYPTAGSTLAVGQVLADRHFETPEGELALADYFEPCAAKSSLLVLRVTAPWCGTCAWHASHTAEFMGSELSKRLWLVDLVVSDEENAPPRLTTLEVLKRTYPDLQKLALDPTFALRDLLVPAGPLPFYVLVDTKTMKVVRTLANPGPDLLISRLRQEIATLDHTDVPNTTLEPRIDDLFGRDQWDLLHAMTLPGAPPDDPSNAFADRADAAALGLSLFSDVDLGPTGKVSCATCHAPEKQFADGLPQGIGVAKVDRKTPPIALSAHARSQFWDGRADSLWAQALGPLEADKEIGSSRLFVAKKVFQKYRATYEAIFGAMPPLDDARFPDHGAPGSPEWASLSLVDQESVTRVFVNVGKSIAAFERTIRLTPSPFDDYVGGNLAALSATEKSALHEFFENGCAQCHHGPRLTDDAYHRLRFQTGRADGLPDLGRSEGIPKLVASEFRRTGRFSDTGVVDTKTEDDRLLAIAKGMDGAFKTPTLRGVALTAPYGHGGTMATAAEVARLYGERGLPAASTLAIGETEPWVPLFSVHHQDLISIFVKSMTNSVAK